MKRITHTHKIAVAALLLFVGACALYYLMLQRIHAIALELDDAIVARNEAYHLSQNLDQMQSLVERTATNRDTLAAYRLSIKDPTAFLQLAEDVALELGVVLDVESLALESYGEDDAQRVRAVFEVLGSWEQVFYLMRLLERIPYAAAIDHVALKETEDLELGVVWKGQVRMWVVADE